jgi:hypothetical protein
MTRRRCGACCPKKRERGSLTWSRLRRSSKFYQTSHPGGGKDIIGARKWFTDLVQNEEVLKILPDFSPWWR